jgi:hypothetical protein
MLMIDDRDDDKGEEWPLKGKVADMKGHFRVRI